MAGNDKKANMLWGGRFTGKSLSQLGRQLGAHCRFVVVVG